MISGQQALRPDRAGGRRGAARRRTRWTRRCALADEALVRLRADRAGLFRQLAQVRLDALRKEKVVAQLDLAERQALQLAG